jgi:hypothetical protein
MKSPAQLYPTVLSLIGNLITAYQLIIQTAHALFSQKKNENKP